MPPKYKKRLTELAVAMGTTHEKIVSASRNQKLAFRRRRAIMLLSEEFPNLTTTRLAKLFDRHHTTIIQQRRKAVEQRELPLPE